MLAEKGGGLGSFDGWSFCGFEEDKVEIFCGEGSAGRESFGGLLVEGVEVVGTV